MTTKTQYPVARNCNLSSRTDERGRLVWTAIQWADAGRLDANIGDEEIVLDALDGLEETLAEGAGERDDAAAASACAAAEERVAEMLRQSKCWTLDSIRGLRFDAPEVAAAMERCQWHNAMPVIDTDRRITGSWVYWDSGDDNYANVDDEAAIDRSDALAAGWTVDEDGYARPPAID